MGLSHRMCSQEPVITLFLISLFTPLFTTIWRGCQGLAWWQNQTHRLGAPPGSRGKSWREKAFFAVRACLPCVLALWCWTAACSADVGCPASQQDNIQLIWHPKHARKNKSPHRGLVKGRREASLQDVLRFSCTPDQCSHSVIFALRTLCCACLI